MPVPTPRLRPIRLAAALVPVCLVAGGCGRDAATVPVDTARARSVPLEPRYRLVDTFAPPAADAPAGVPAARASPWAVPASVEPRAWRFIIVHHSATDEGSAEAFRHYHRLRGWDDLAYHFVIGNGSGAPDGSVAMGVRWLEQRVGAHAGSKLHNEYGIGICLVGNFEHAWPTARQLSALRELVAFLMKRFDIPREHVLRHSEVNTTKCPGALMSWPVW